MKTLRTTLTDFKTYTLHPQYVDAPDAQKTRGIGQFLTEYPLFLSVTILAVGMLLINSYVTGEDSLHLFPADRHYTATTMLIAAFLLALYIEALFRSLLRLTPGRVSGVVKLILFILIGAFSEAGKRATNEYFVIWSLLAWLVLSFPIGWFLKRPAVFERIERFWKVHFQWIFYGSSLLYGLFWLKGITALWLLVLLGPVLLISLYLGYVRMTYGFWYAVFVQALIISIPVAREMIRILYF